MLTRQQLKKFAPNARKDILDAILSNWSYAVSKGLGQPKRMRPFLANLAGETDGFRILEESMYYTTASRMMKVWPTRFRTTASTLPFLKNPIKLAQKVYGGRMGNKPAPSLDGWTYRGGGLIQTTGREGYRKVGFEDNPDALRKDANKAFIAAVDEWNGYGLNPLADAGQFRAIRKRINGGYNGWPLVEMYRKRAESIWGNDADITSAEKVLGPSADEELERVKLVKQIQKELISLGYGEVGRIDGDVGKMTKAALRAFLDEHDLPADTPIDEHLLEVLEESRPRVPHRREAATNKEVRKEVPEVQANFITKIISAVTAAVSALITLISGIADKIGDAADKINPMKYIAEDVPSWVWLVAVTVIAATLYVVAHKGELAGVLAFKKGRRR